MLVALASLCCSLLESDEGYTTFDDISGFGYVVRMVEN